MHQTKGNPVGNFKDECRGENNTIHLHLVLLVLS